MTSALVAKMDLLNTFDLVAKEDGVTVTAHVPYKKLSIQVLFPDSKPVTKPVRCVTTKDRGASVSRSTIQPQQIGARTQMQGQWNDLTELDEIELTWEW